MRKFTLYNIKLILVAMILFATSQQSIAQVDAQHTQYFEVPSYYNPAATGTTDFVNIHGGTRMQWVGIENAPQSFLITADMPFKFLNKRFGVGAVMQQES